MRDRRRLRALDHHPARPRRPAAPTTRRPGPSRFGGGTSGDASGVLSSGCRKLEGAIHVQQWQTAAGGRPQRYAVVGRQNLTRAQIGDADAVLDLFRLLFTTVQAAARSHQELVLENLLLRHQLAVLTRPTRTRPQARFASGTSCCGSSLAGSASAGAGICPSSHPRRSCAGIGRAGACSGVGSPALEVDVRISVPRYGT
jgi:hypothetical protein